MMTEYISPDWELPPCDGEYEIRDMFGREGVAEFNAERGAFLPTSGFVGLDGWRVPLPDAADLAEFRARERLCYPCCDVKGDTYGYENSD